MNGAAETTVTNSVSRAVCHEIYCNLNPLQSFVHALLDSNANVL